VHSAGAMPEDHRDRELSAASPVGGTPAAPRAWSNQ
jgi:hypothetical protein